MNVVLFYEFGTPKIKEEKAVPEPTTCYYSRAHHNHLIYLYFNPSATYLNLLISSWHLSASANSEMLQGPPQKKFLKKDG